MPFTAAAARRLTAVLHVIVTGVDCLLNPLFHGCGAVCAFGTRNTALLPLLRARQRAVSPPPPGERAHAAAPSVPARQLGVQRQQQYQFTSR